MRFLLGAAGGGARGGACWLGLGVVGVVGDLRVFCWWSGPGGRGARVDGVGVALLLVGGAGFGVVLDRSLSNSARSFGYCVCMSCRSHGPWLAVVASSKMVAWASGWGCGP